MSIEFKLPDLGEGIHEAEILSIKVAEGDPVKEDQIIFEVETDKAVVEIPCPVEGRVEKLHVRVGDTATVGKPLITFQPSGSTRAPQSAGNERTQAASVRAGARQEAGAAAGKPAAGNGGSAPCSDLPQMRSQLSPGPVPAAPATRRLARELGVDLKMIQGSGQGGRVLKEDIRAFAEGIPASQRATLLTPALQELTPGVISARDGSMQQDSGIGSLASTPYQLPDFTRWGACERIPLKSLRRKIALNMSQSWAHVPRVSSFDEADITELERWRQKHEKSVLDRGGKLTLTVLAMKAVVSALKRFGQFNSSLDENTSEVVLKHYFNIGVAVATERGLIVPVIRNVDSKSILELARELADVASRTRTGKIDLEYLQGGTFTITNIGAIGGTGSVPMVNHPEAAILGMARAADKPVVVDGQIVIRKILPLSMSFDHRIADGAEAAMFVRHVATCLEDPFQLVLEV